MNSPASLPNPLPRKLNAGCGFDYRTGYLNVDMHAMHKPDLVADVTCLPMLPDAAFDEIVAQDVLEHFERTKTAPALAEWARLLNLGGVLHLRVPSLFGMFELLSLPENRQADKAEQIIHLMYGTQAYTGDFHLAGFTAVTLSAHLQNAGLLICDARIRDQWLFDVSARKCDYLVENLEFLHWAYFTVLDRPIDASGLAAYGHALSDGKMNRDQVLASLHQSPEAQFIQKSPAYLTSYMHHFQD